MPPYDWHLLIHRIREAKSDEEAFLIYEEETPSPEPTPVYPNEARSDTDSPSAKCTVLPINTTDMRRFNHDEILYVIAQRTYCDIYLDNPEHEMVEISKPLKWLQEKMNDDSFVRINRSHFINTAMVKQHHHDLKNVTMKDGKLFPVHFDNDLEMKERLKKLLER